MITYAHYELWPDVVAKTFNPAQEAERRIREEAATYAANFGLRAEWNTVFDRTFVIGFSMLPGARTPIGLRPDGADRRLFVPWLKTPEGKQIRNTMATFTHPSPLGILWQITGEREQLHVDCEMTNVQPFFVRVGDRVFVSIPEHVLNPGLSLKVATRLQPSAYWLTRGM